MLHMYYKPANMRTLWKSPKSWLRGRLEILNNPSLNNPGIIFSNNWASYCWHTSPVPAKFWLAITGLVYPCQVTNYPPGMGHLAWKGLFTILLFLFTLYTALIWKPMSKWGTLYLDQTMRKSFDASASKHQNLYQHTIISRCLKLYVI